MKKPSLQEKIRAFLWRLKSEPELQKRAMLIVIALFVVVALALIFVFTRNPNEAVDSDNVVNLDLLETANDDLSGTAFRFIDGVEVEAGRENLLPVAIMIENLVTVRPQSGLQSANVVYEALAEGGITRFMAVFASGDAVEEIGPVRSAREYYVEWAEEYEGMYAHAGGSPTALSRLYQNSYLTDLNQISGDHSYFWRDSATAAPHNLYTSSELLAFAQRDKGQEGNSGTYSPWRFSGSSEASTLGDVTSITIPYSSSSYEVEYTYDSNSNTYLRSNGGVAHTDENTGEQIAVHNILVQYVGTSLSGDDQGRLNINTTGTGEALLFNNGTVIEGTWAKTGAGERTRFFTEDGVEMTFNPGNIWVQVVPNDRTVEYTQ